MKISSYMDTKPIQELPGVLKRDVICTEDGAPNFCMRVFEIEPGSSTQFHCHYWEHEVFILSGQGVVKSVSGETQITKDTVVFVPPDEQHCFINTGKKTLRFICVIPIVQ